MHFTLRRAGQTSPLTMPAVTAGFDDRVRDRARAHSYVLVVPLSVIAEESVSIADEHATRASRAAMTSLSRARCRPVAGSPQHA